MGEGEDFKIKTRESEDAESKKGPMFGIPSGSGITENNLFMQESKTDMAKEFQDPELLRALSEESDRKKKEADESVEKGEPIFGIPYGEGMTKNNLFMQPEREIPEGEKPPEKEE